MRHANSSRMTRHPGTTPLDQLLLHIADIERAAGAPLEAGDALAWAADVCSALGGTRPTMAPLGEAIRRDRERQTGTERRYERRLLNKQLRRLRGRLNRLTRLTARLARTSTGTPQTRFQAALAMQRYVHGWLVDVSAFSKRLRAHLQPSSTMRWEPVSRTDTPGPQSTAHAVG